MPAIAGTMLAPEWIWIGGKNSGFAAAAVDRRRPACSAFAAAFLRAAEYNAVPHKPASRKEDRSWTRLLIEA